MEAANILFLIAIISSISYYNVARGDGTATESIKLEDQPKPFEDERPVVRIKTQGLVRGRRASDGPYNEYLGIHYATTSPETRFMAPGQGPTWEGIIDADNGDTVCPQFNATTQKVDGEEDCLTLNVYTPLNTTSNSKLAVIVYVHGGRFMFQMCCRKSFYGPKRFVAENIILVNFSYRKSILGFLCNHEAANGGLKDVVAALKWVRENIEAFGGDPNKVTLMGHSSGSSMVEILMLSEQTKGLFHAAIAMSGSALSSVCFSEHPEKKAYNVAKKFGYEGNDHYEMMKVLKSADISNLLTAFINIKNDEFEMVPITPCIESESNLDAIITANPADIIKHGKYNDIPYMQGIVKNEGLVIYEELHTNPNYLKTVAQNFIHTLPKDLQLSSLASKERVARLVNQFYFNGKNISEASIEKVVDYMGDIMFVLPIIRSVKSFSKSNRTSPLYLYSFNYDGGMPGLKYYLNIMDIPGVCHSDDLGYLWTRDGLSPKTENDILAAQRLTKLWTNFAKHGDPTPETSELIPVRWETAEDLKYLSIGNNLKMEQRPFEERMAFWESIYNNITNIVA